SQDAPNDRAVGVLLAGRGLVLTPDGAVDDVGPGAGRPVDGAALEGVHAAALHARHVHLVAGRQADQALNHVAVSVLLVGRGLILAHDGAVEDVGAGGGRPVDVAARESVHAGAGYARHVRLVAGRQADEMLNVVAIGVLLIRRGLILGPD